MDACEHARTWPPIIVWASLSIILTPFSEGKLAGDAGGKPIRAQVHLYSPAAILIGEAYEIVATMRDNADSGRIAGMEEIFEARLAAAKEKDPALMDHGWSLRDLHTAQLARAAMLKGENNAAIHLLNRAIIACQRDGRGLAEQKLNLLKVTFLMRQTKRPEALRLLIQTAETAVRSGLFRFLSMNAAS